MEFKKDGWVKARLFDTRYECYCLGSTLMNVHVNQPVYENLVSGTQCDDLVSFDTLSIAPERFQDRSLLLLKFPEISHAINLSIFACRNRRPSVSRRRSSGFLATLPSTTLRSPGSSSLFPSLSLRLILR